MELDFDKEIDTILRKARPGKGVPVGDIASPHLDADGIAAFAEYALPEKSRQAYMVHFADCNRCREILSDTILMNAEAAPETVFAAAPAIITAAEPWYRKLFLFPNLAYVMGGLVLMFSAFLGYSVLQNAGSNSSSSEVSQMEDAPSAASGPNAGEEPVYPSAMSSNANMSAANTMSSVANTMANSSAANLANSASARSNSSSLPVVTGRALDAPPSEVLTERDKDVAVTSADSVAPQQPAPLPAPAARERPVQQKEDASAGAGKNEVRDAEESKLSAKKATVQMPRMDGGPFKSAGPQRNQQRNFPNQVQNNEYEVAVTRAVGGKKFQRRDGIWYDSAYRGQVTTNIRRGTEQYRNLDGGLRSIAESLDGTVVTVWNGKAYRIQ